MSNHITLPPGWNPPKFSFLQRVKFSEYRFYEELPAEEFGVIVGFDHQPDSDYSDLKPGWWCHIILDEDSPGFMRDLTEIRHEDDLTLIDQEVSEPCKR